MNESICDQTTFHIVIKGKWHHSVVQEILQKACIEIFTSNHQVLDTELYQETLKAEWHRKNENKV